jgi:hypothetical protein
MGTWLLRLLPARIGQGEGYRYSGLREIFPNSIGSAYERNAPNEPGPR